jgi:hypothetical protein
VYYYENYEQQNADPITLAADDGGNILTDNYRGRTGTNGNPATGFTHPGGVDGKPVAFFTYITTGAGVEERVTATNPDGTPAETARFITRTLTATANGLSKQLTFTTVYR